MDKKGYKKLTLKNYFFATALYRDYPSLAEWLIQQLLHGPASRARTRFLRLVEPRITEISSERIRLLREYSKKDATDKALYIDKDGKETTDETKAVKAALKDEQKFNDEFTSYLNEDFVLDVTPAVSDAIYGVRDILLQTTEQFEGRGATNYEEWCQCFESIK